MEQSELYDLWQADAGGGRQNKDRPAFVREHRDAITEHTDTDDAIPSGENPELAEIRDWLERYKGTVTRQLQPDDGGSE